jgi:Skp family chaperone for outer membrane proteins
MSIIRRVFAGLIIFAATSFSIFSQTTRRPVTNPTPAPTPAPARTTPASALTVAVPDSKIALINTEMFGDEKAGIFRYVDAVKILQNEFRPRQQELQGLQTRINGLVEDIRKLRAAPTVDQRAVQLKEEEGSRLQQDFTTRQQRFNEDYNKRYQDVTAPISEQIGKAMDAFANEHGITMTLDVSKLLPAMLTALPTLDVTEAFIAEFNRKNPRTGSAPR